MRVGDIRWIAGLLEGEGCFALVKIKGRHYQQARLSVWTQDRDVIERACRLMKATLKRRLSKRGNKTMWGTVITNRRAIQWMMTLYVELGARRQAAVRKCIEQWRRQIPRVRTAA